AAIRRPIINGTAGTKASSALSFPLAIEPGPQDDVRGDLEPRRQDDEFEKSERGCERGGFRDNLSGEIRAATRNRGREPRPGVVHDLQRAHVMPRRRNPAQEELRIPD